MQVNRYKKKGLTLMKKINHEPIIGKLGADIIGPTNPSREAENSDVLCPPRTDKGIVANLRWSFADSHMRIEEGGWARETTIRELPSSPSIAGVNMRLKRGAVREMHWHREAEWAYMLKGQARLASIDAAGNAFEDEVSEGDLWYFPAGIPHAIQGIGDDGCEFLLVFDDGDFSEDSTFLLTDWLAHTPKEILAKNFGVPQNTFDNIPKSELYIFPASVPEKLVKEIPSSQSFTYRMLKQEPLRFAHGTVRITDSSNFSISKTIAAGLVEIEPGGMRELHWHTNTDEWQYYISGKARMTVFASEGTARTFNFQAGDVGSVPFPMAHYIENIGDTTLRFLEVFKSDHFADVSLAQWLAKTPHDLVRAHLNVPESFLQNLPTTKIPIV
jgi:oxalate decarboxylase